MKNRTFISLVMFFSFILSACAMPSSTPNTEVVTEIAPTAMIPPTQTPPPVTVIPATAMPAESLPLASNSGQGIIAYYTKNDKLGGIEVIGADGSGYPIALTILLPKYDSNHSWSLDGSKIAFNAFRDDVANSKHLDIYTMNADGSHLTRVTNTDGWYVDPEWSPNGDQLVVAAQKDGESNMDLYILELASGKMTRLTEDPANDRNPSWSPDGSKISFASDRGGEWNIYIIDVNTGITTQLTSNTGNSGQPDWSPDGDRILFSARRDENTEIYVMNTDGSEQTQLTNTPRDDWDPEWSPDGKYFAYASGDNDHSSIFIASLDSATAWLLVEDDGYRGSPAWSGTALISNEPMFGPLMCVRDTNADLKPDAVTNTFPMTELIQDRIPYIMFPYRNIDPNAVMSIMYSYEKNNTNIMSDPMKWEYGENGLYVSSPIGLIIPSDPQNLTIRVLLNGEVVQEIDCPIVEQ